MFGSPHRPREGVSSSVRARELSVRIISALVLMPLALGAAYLGGRPFVALCTVAALGIWWEWVTLSAGREAWSLMTTGAGALIAAAVFLSVGWIVTPVACIAGGALLVAMLARSERPLWIGLGVAYAGGMLVAPTMLRSDPDYGWRAILFLFGVVWSTDIAAYFVGRAVGGPKLAPRLSPNKTWSGALGGAGAGVITAVILAATADLGHAAALALVALALSAAAQAGDLFESAFKRWYGVKDASALIPGHGGLMDRLDGFIAAALLATILGVLRDGAGAPAHGLLVW